MRNILTVPANENKLWEGGPDTRVSVFEAIFNPMLFFALIWGAIDLGIIGMMFGQGMSSEFGGLAIGMVLFFAVHMMPVWIYLGGVVTSALKAKNTYYVVTDRAVYTQTGVFTIKTERSPLNEIVHTGVHIGIFDNMFGVGDVQIECTHENHSISNIRDFMQVSQMIAQVSQDQYTDTMYPNDLRPESNHGYNTVYTPNNDYRNRF